MDGKDLKTMFSFLDAKGGGNVTASAEIVLRNGQIMTIRAGGPGTHSRPSSPPFEAYEVLLDHDPPRFWRRYNAVGSCLYDQVPGMLVTHHVIRRGGIEQMELSDNKVERAVLMNVSLYVGESHARLVREAVERVDSVKLISSQLTFG